MSICMPAFNAANYIGDTISCLLSQTYYNIEIIVVDDHSTDSTINIIKAFNDSRLRFFTNPKKFAASARNFAYKNSKGEYIIFFDADDLVEKEFIEKQVRKLCEDENSVVISNWGRFYNNDLATYVEAPHTIKKDLTYEEWILTYWLEVRHTTPPGRIAISRQLVEKTPLWDETLTLNDDFQFFNELFFHCNMIRHNNANFYYRSGINGLSTRIGEKFYQSSLKALKRGIELAKKKYPNKHHLELCYANMLKNLEYEVYPITNLTKLVKIEQRALPKATFKFPAGGITRIIILVIGWKMTKRIKRWANI